MKLDQISPVPVDFKYCPLVPVVPPTERVVRVETPNTLILVLVREVIIPVV